MNSLRTFIARRGTIREQSRLLRRARNLYIALCQKAIMADKTNFTLDYCALRMIEAQLYASSSEGSVRFSIVKRISGNDIRARRFEPKRSSWGWHEWVDLHNFNFYTRHFDSERRSDIEKRQSAHDENRAARSKVA